MSADTEDVSLPVVVSAVVVTTKDPEAAIAALNSDVLRGATVGVAVAVTYSPAATVAASVAPMVAKPEALVVTFVKPR
jgi:hypothetical protein